MSSKKVPFTFLVEFLVLLVKTDLFLCHCDSAVMQLQHSDEYIILFIYFTCGCAWIVSLDVQDAGVCL